VTANDPHISQQLSDLDKCKSPVDCCLGATLRGLVTLLRDCLSSLKYFVEGVLFYNCFFQGGLFSEFDEFMLLLRVWVRLSLR